MVAAVKEIPNLKEKNVQRSFCASQEIIVWLIKCPFTKTFLSHMSGKLILKAAVTVASLK